jgi:3-hydroxybutyryl-CoA dehydrogenase
LSSFAAEEDVVKIGVVGAGMMGSEIALTFALANHEVRLSDAAEDRLATAMKNIAAILNKGVMRQFWPEDDAKRALCQIYTTDKLRDYANCDVVIEAVSEDEVIKGGLFGQLDKICRDGCLIASNTSSISISVLASYLSPARRANFLGTHFFSPVTRMKLVEVIPGIDSDPRAVEAAKALCQSAGKTPIQVKDVVGFAVNRLLHALLIEATRLAEEGVADPADIDTACKLGLGHPVGPFELMDLVSNTLTLQVQEVLLAAYGERFRPPMSLKKLVKAGYDGRKVGRGWLRWDNKVR